MCEQGWFCGIISDRWHLGLPICYLSSLQEAGKITSLSFFVLRDYLLWKQVFTLRKMLVGSPEIEMDGRPGHPANVRVSGSRGQTAWAVAVEHFGPRESTAMARKASITCLLVWLGVWVTESPLQGGAVVLCGAESQGHAVTCLCRTFLHKICLLKALCAN